MNVRLRLAAAALASLAASCATPASDLDPGPGAPRGDGARLDSPPGAVNVGFLVVDGAYNTELTAPYDIFHHTVFHVDPGMRVFTVAPDAGPVTTFEGLRLLPDFTFADAPRIDVLVVPSAEHSMDTDLEDEALIEWVRATGEEAAWIVSLCDGAFVLAQAGLLDGHLATTFPTDVERMREMFPAVEVLDDVSFVHDGKALTSVGGAPSFEPALYLCQRLYGAEIARDVGRGLVIDWELEVVRHVAGRAAGPEDLLLEPAGAADR